MPHSLTDYCQGEDHNYATRSKIRGQLYMYIPKWKTTQGQFSISCVGVKLWNCIPCDVKKKKTSTNAFRKGLITYLHTHYFDT